MISDEELRLQTEIEHLLLDAQRLQSETEHHGWLDVAITLADVASDIREAARYLEDHLGGEVPRTDEDGAT